MCCSEEHLLYCESATKPKAQEHLINARAYGLLAGAAHLHVNISAIVLKREKKKASRHKENIKGLFVCFSGQQPSIFEG